MVLKIKRKKNKKQNKTTQKIKGNGTAQWKRKKIKATWRMCMDIFVN